MLPDIPDKPEILDIGCGPGRQTMVLAKHTNGHITALDTHQPFLDEVHIRAENTGVGERVTTVNRSMSEMDFAPHSFDIIWSEGAIYIMGFEKGLQFCKQSLKPGGFIAVTELTWLKGNPPEELRSYWERVYPAMKSGPEHIAIIEEAGYTLVDHFALPDSCWWDYYRPLEERIGQMRRKYAGAEEVLDFLDESQAEIDVYRQYSDCYGYVFYLMYVKSR